jgi:hypothetical protein
MCIFWKCPKARTTWEQAFSFLCNLKSPIETSLVGGPLVLNNVCLLRNCLTNLEEFNLLWSLIRGQFDLKGMI